MTKTVLTAARQLSEIRSEAIHFLQSQQMDDAMIEVDYLLEHVTGLPHQSIPTHLKNEIPELTDLRFQQLLQKRSQRIPLAYLLEEQPFDQYSFYVTPTVLIPRPETEHLVSRVRERLKDIPQADIVDVGTGSGCIALSIASNPHIHTLYAVDVSPEALRVAQENQKRLRITKPVRWIENDLLNYFTEERFHVIVANLPYIRSSVIPTLSPEVQQEPVLALDGGVRGTELIERLIQQAEQFLHPKGWLLLEIGFDQESELLSYFQTRGSCWDNVTCIKDYAGLPRIIEAQKS